MKIILSESVCVYKELPHTMLYLMHADVCWQYIVFVIPESGKKNENDAVPRDR